MNKPKVLVADPVSERGVAELQEGGLLDVTVKTGLKEDELLKVIAEFDGLVVRSQTKVNARVIEAAKNLKVVGRAGVGVDNVDVEAATKRGVVVMNTPGGNTISTAEQAFSLLMAISRNIPQADASMKAGKWDRKSFEGVELYGKTLAILGMGRIGTEIARRAIAFGMRVYAYDPYLSASRARSLQVELVERLDEIIPLADYITLHMPLTDETRNMLNAERLAKAKKGVRVINCARGGLVDEKALFDALKNRQVAAAALDVYEVEPPPADFPLRTLPNVVLTPHLGASTREAKHNVSIEMARQVVTCLRRGIVLNGVNVPRIAPSEAAQIEPFLNLTHNLASFLLQVFPGTLQSLRLTLQGELPATAAKPLCIAMLTGALQHRAKIPVTPVNAERIARAEKVRVHTESSALKRDFLHLVRVEALIDEERHFITGTVLGHRHGRMVELDRYLLDAIPEGPLLVTFHRDRPGVIGRIGTLLGCHEINISRLQLAAPQEPADDVALGILNLSSPLPPAALQALRGSQEIVRACSVIC